MKTLAFEEKHGTKYCIPIELRDAQIAANIKRVAKRVQPVEKKIDEPCAIVCYGPSLAQTWEKLRGYKHIFTCSGAHRFLLDKGIRSKGRKWYHVDVDPRPHKATMLGKPDKGIHYLASSTCHPTYFDKLNGMDVALWHVFDNSSEAEAVLPRGEWCLTGGANVGMRSMVLARFHGYINLHVFGMDGSFDADGHRHAGEHPNKLRADFETEFNGKKFTTTPSMLECAKQTPHEVNMLPDVEVTFHGEGLVQEIMRDFRKTKPPQGSIIAVEKPELISAEYRRMSEELHAQHLEYGISGRHYMDVVLKLAQSLNTTAVLDYGCGKGTLAKAMPFPIWEYDPAIPGKTALPRPADIVVCTDVLEHVEPERLLFVLADLRRVVQKVGYFVVHLGPAHKSLSDGRNAHLIQKSPAWWEKTIGQFFEIGRVWKKGTNKAGALHIVVGPRKEAIRFRKAA